MSAEKGLRDYARILLALIRLFNGLAALLVPSFLARQVGIDPDATRARCMCFACSAFGPSCSASSC